MKIEKFLKNNKKKKSLNASFITPISKRHEIFSLNINCKNIAKNEMRVKSVKNIYLFASQLNTV